MKSLGPPQEDQIAILPNRLGVRPRPPRAQWVLGGIREVAASPPSSADPSASTSYFLLALTVDFPPPPPPPPLPWDFLALGAILLSTHLPPFLTFALFGAAVLAGGLWVAGAR